MREFEQWDGFTGRLWKEGIDVRDFIQNNYTPYDGDEKFLEVTDRGYRPSVGQITGTPERRACKRWRSGYGDRRCKRNHSLRRSIYR